jgi:alpha-tubulin suppressor-like RCC1 family protein
MVTRAGCLLLTALSALAAMRCSGGGDSNDGGADTDADSGSESDAGTDSGPDSGSDTDTDTDSDADTDTGPGNNAVHVAAGGRHTCALVDGGYLKCWGDQIYGQLGYGQDLDEYPDADGSLPATLPFVNVGGLVASVDGGGLHTCVLLSDGAVKCWGYNGFGQLGVEIPPGNGDTLGLIDVPADYAPVGLDGQIVQVSAGGSHTCVLMDDGCATCWGDGQFGQLGYGSPLSVYDPAEAGCVALGGAAVQISAGARHTCAVLENGDVLCWGSGGGSLGYGNTETVGDDEVPADVGPVDLGGPAVQVSAGYYHTCAVLETGEVLCWGLGDYGALGYGNTEEIGDDEVPADVGPVDVGGDAMQISSGSFNTCALLGEGDVKCWGSGGGVPLGYGSTDSVGMTNVPADVGFVDLGGPAVLLDNGYSHICALLESGDVICWGSEGDDLGYGDTGDIGDDEVPADVGAVQLF